METLFPFRPVATKQVPSLDRTTPNPAAKISNEKIKHTSFENGFLFFGILEKNIWNYFYQTTRLQAKKKKKILSLLHF